MNQWRLRDTNLLNWFLIFRAGFWFQVFKIWDTRFQCFTVAWAFGNLNRTFTFLGTRDGVFHCFLDLFLCLWWRTHSWTMTCLECLCLTLACQHSCLHCSLVENVPPSHLKHPTRETDDLFLRLTRESLTAPTSECSRKPVPLGSESRIKKKKLLLHIRPRLHDAHPRKFECSWSWESDVSQVPSVPTPPDRQAWSCRSFICSLPSPRTATPRTPSVQSPLRVREESIVPEKLHFELMIVFDSQVSSAGEMVTDKFAFPSTFKPVATSLLALVSTVNVKEVTLIS